MAEEQGGVQSTIDLYDSDILKIEKLLVWLNENLVGHKKVIDGADRQIIDKFAEIGFEVTVQWWTSTELGTYIPEITIQDRIDTRHEFDHDRMVHEVTNDILDLGTGGVIKSKDAAASLKAHKH